MARRGSIEMEIKSEQKSTTGKQNLFVDVDGCLLSALIDSFKKCLPVADAKLAGTFL